MNFICSCNANSISLVEYLPSAQPPFPESSWQKLPVFAEIILVHKLKISPLESVDSAGKGPLNRHITVWQMLAMQQALISIIAVLKFGQCPSY